MVKISRRSDGGKSTKMSFKNVRYGSQKTVSNHLNGSKEKLEPPGAVVLDGKKIIAVIDTTFAVVKRKPEKNQACMGFKPYDLCDNQLH